MDVLLIEDLGQQRLNARALAAVLRQAGLSARCLHFGPDSHAAGIVAQAREENPRLIVLSILFEHMATQSLALADRLRANGIAAHLTMVGALPTFACADLLAAAPALDSVLRGEAEASIVQLATGLEEGNWQSTPGLAWRGGVNPLPRPTANLDELPFPAWDDPLPVAHGVGFVTVEASRGCYHACALCLASSFYRAGGRAYRQRSMSNLAEEMEALYRRGARLFLFDDEQFLPPRRARAARVAALDEELQRRGMEIAFTIKSRADDVEEALFRQLQAMGLLRVYLGIESGCQATLDTLDKGTTVAQNVAALTLLDALGIVADFNCLIIQPWSTLETIRAEVDFLEEVLSLVPTPFTFHQVGCYAGTALAARLRAEGRGAGPPWLPAYTLTDLRAELLRRLLPIVWGSASQRLYEQIAQAWFNLLLRRRFQRENPAAEMRALRETVARLNRTALDIWREMIALVEREPLPTVEQVNEQAAAWAGRVNTLALHLGKTACLLPRPRRLRRTTRRRQAGTR